ncbi:subtilisin-like protease SBT1.3 [Iris pallida]|uniref:Subtilisin-like protease SBT1.3 n=1 Tax=Iris pallida TaxID=29817 RepID=A0AAX6EG47_IRIPA|nr:subtilisin-like protease SBT1.3 [Iris pallida]
MAREPQLQRQGHGPRAHPVERQVRGRPGLRQQQLQQEDRRRENVLPRLRGLRWRDRRQGGVQVAQGPGRAWDSHRRNRRRCFRPGANLFGYARGTARGMAPRARVAVYKVCWTGGCFSSDILAAVDKAVADGVDVLSISLGGGVSSYYRDSLSVAAFGAMEMGVFVACSAGNAGPDPISLTNVSPWITTSELARWTGTFRLSLSSALA